MSEEQKTPKANGFKPDPLASEIFLREIDAFRRRRRFNMFTKVRPFITYLITYKGKKQDFYEFVNDYLEKFRCSLGMSTSRFYKIAAEFVLAPGGRNYYTPQRLFDSVSYEADEFRDRLLIILGHITHVVEIRDNEDEIHKFGSSVEEVNRHILDMKCGRATKDWFCLAEVLRYFKSKNWTVAELHKKLKANYQRRQRKVYPETLLIDVVVHHDLDNIVKRDDKPKKKKDVIDAIHEADWFDDWGKQLEERRVKDESGEKIE